MDGAEPPDTRARLELAPATSPAVDAGHPALGELIAKSEVARQASVHSAPRLTRRRPMNTWALPRDGFAAGNRKSLRHVRSRPDRLRTRPLARGIWAQPAPLRRARGARRTDRRRGTGLAAWRGHAIQDDASLHAVSLDDAHRSTCPRRSRVSRFLGSLRSVSTLKAFNLTSSTPRPVSAMLGSTRGRTGHWRRTGRSRQHRVGAPRPAGARGHGVILEDLMYCISGETLHLLPLQALQLQHRARLPRC